jgi:2-polyprenyl-6-methoxyphenol hydroxylase-like FAD-dependent oxidoreductase
MKQGENTQAVAAGGRSAAVIGAGIGGLAAAIALTRAGWEATVYEASGELRPLGAGLSIWPNGVRSLRALGLGDFAGAALRTGGALRRADGSVLTEFDPEVLEQRFGAPLVGMHRADLHEALVGALGDSRVRLGMRLEEVGGEELRFADGSTLRADLVVGADGLNSTVRATLLGDGKPRDSGMVTFRGVAEVAGEVPVGEWWGPGTAAGLLQLGGARVYWYVAYRGEPRPEALPGLLSAYGPAIREIVERTPAEEVLLHRLYDRDPVESWSQGSTTLLGDAAHPMLPFLGQGACSALEDAVALGAAVGEDSVAAALARYEGERVGPTTALVAGSRRAGRGVLLESRLGRRLRNAVIPRVPASARLRQLDPYAGRA